MSKETVGTLSEQLQTNYALRADMTREEFLREGMMRMGGEGEGQPDV
jgi:hypothetical protein